MEQPAIGDCSLSLEFKPVVIGVLGGPGSGKGTQCKLICKAYRVEHVSIGDVLRADMNREESPYADIIRRNMLAGTVGPKEVTIPILRSHMNKAAENGINVFILDGFPRNTDQLQYFESLISPLKLVILLQCSEQAMVNRLLSRERFDDTESSIRGRLLTFNTVTSQVVDSIRERGCLKMVNAEQPVEVVSKEISTILSTIAERRK